jgi:DNA-binding XRE family transcriptional regulator
MSNFVDGIEFVTVTCGGCNMPFAMTRQFYDKQRSSHGSFSCPAGCNRKFTGPTEEFRLRQEVERKESMLEAERARAAKAQQERDEIQRAHKRMRTRVMNGVCPCCNRTFQNLLNHMRTEHASELSLKNLREAYGLTQSAIAKEIGVKPAYVSNFENERYVPEYAKQAIGVWLSRQEPADSATERKS